MPNDDFSSRKDYTVVVHHVGYWICQTIITIQQQQPELLSQKYRNINWRSSRSQAAVNFKLKEILDQVQDKHAFFQKLQGLLKAIFTSEAFNSPTLIALFERLQKLNSVKPAANGLIDSQRENSSNIILPAASSTSKSLTGIAVLLLDVENIQLNTETERFLATVCTYPLQVKIAFANWCCMGKRDIEFHQRSYDLIHVPAGRDNADGKMIAFGSSLHEHYPKAKEVLVCSSDKVMTNLCNQLQQNGLTVYRVSQQGININVLNTKTGESYTHTIVEPPELDKLLRQLQKIIISEEKRTSNPWIGWSQIAQIYNQKYHCDINEILSFHYPGKTIKDVLKKYQSDIVIYQIPENSETYLTVFRKPPLHQLSSDRSGFKKEVNSKADLEQALVATVATLSKKFPDRRVPLETLGTQFYKHYGQGISKILTNLGLSRNFRTFLLNECHSLEVYNQGDRTRVGLRENKS